MTSIDPRHWMWADACALIDRAERLRRSFFVPCQSSESSQGWEPPVDIYETDAHFWVVAALPGVADASIEITRLPEVLIVSGRRELPASMRRALIHRLELPYGRFVRRIPLPADRLTLVETSVADGCLLLKLEKRR